MKFSVFLLLGLAVSCGKYEALNSANSTVGETKSLKVEALTSSEQSLMSQVCSSLAQKNTDLGRAQGATFSFSTSQSDCSGQTSSGDVTTYIQGSNGSYSFKVKSDNSDFIFPNVETPSSGVLSELCSNVGTGNGGLVTSQEVTFFKVRDISLADCAPVSGEVCVYVEKGTNQGNDTVKIHTKEWIRVRTNSNQGKIGFFTYRKRVSQAFCGQNQALIQSVTLK